MDQQRQLDKQMMDMMMENQRQMIQQQKQQQEMLLETINNMQRPVVRINERVLANSAKKTKCPKWEEKDTIFYRKVGNLEQY